MPDVIADARKLIEDRLRELEAEAVRLRGALTSLASDSPRPTSDQRSRRATRARTGTRGTRAPRGQRETEFLAVLKKSPGAKVPAIADEMGVASSQVYGVARRLHHAGRIRKRRGGGYALKA